MMRAAPDPIKHIAGEIERAGYVVVQRFLDDPVCAMLARACRESTLRPAAIGRAATHRARSDIRGDRTHWFEPEALTPAQRPYWEAMQTLRSGLNRALLLGLEELEAHYALYPPGARYERHRDRFRDDDARVLSSVLYLNRDWCENDGGQLRLYLPQNTHVDIYPRAGTLALFLSAEFEHEVLPATRERLSVAGWFRRRSS